MTIQECLQKASCQTDAKSARKLLAATLGISYETIFAHPERTLSVREKDQFQDFLKRYLEHEPLSKIIGHREFWGLPFTITHDTLDPRPDSETLIEEILKHFPDREKAYSILDLGTGSGCLLLAALSEYPNASGIGIDISSAALTVAQKNAQDLGFADRCTFVKGSFEKDLQGSFDIILCNPPYIRYDEKKDLSPAVVLYDPPQALFAEAQGLQNYLLIAPQLSNILNSQGLAFFEIGQGQQASVSDIFTQAFLHVKGVYPDLAGIARCIVVGEE